MRRYLPFTIVAAVALLTLASATLLYRAKRVPALAMTKAQAGAQKNRGGGPNGGQSQHLRGNPNAPITLEEFGDFQCPPCGGLAGIIKQIEQEYGERLRVIFSQLPLAAHQHARKAACAAEAAGMQNKFWEMHDLLYREQAVWSNAADARALFGAYAGILRLDISRFNRDVDGEEAKSRIAADEKRAAALGINSTPTIFINDKALPPASLNSNGLHEGINQALKAKSPP